MCLLFTVAAGARQRSHCKKVQVLWDSWPHFIVSDLRLPQPVGPRSHIYIPQEQGGPVVTAGTGFFFGLLPRLAGQRWGYSNPNCTSVGVLVTWTAYYTPTPTVPVLLRVVSLL
jgi:hypothetical protein